MRPPRQPLTIPLLIWSSGVIASAAVRGTSVVKGVETQNKCQPQFQCVGTTPTDTVIKPGTCQCSDRSETPTCPSSVKSWAQCTWPQSTAFVNISRPPYFDLSQAVAPSDHLRGLADMDTDARQAAFRQGVQVMTDVDDTLVCSGGKWPAGIDTNCTQGFIYPGAPAFYYAASLAWTPDVAWGTTIARGAVPFSARPKSLSFILGMSKCDGLDLNIRRDICKCADKQACKNGRCDCFGIDTEDAMYGRIRDALKDLVVEGGQSFNHLGLTKAANFMAFRQHLQTPAIFIGDNGQGDLSSAQMMLLVSQDVWRRGDGDVRGALIAAFIHDVARTCESSECRDAWARHNIFHFSTYREAADMASKLGLIPEAYVEMVA